MTVERILAEMTVTERNGWMLYFLERAEEREREAAQAAPAGPVTTVGRGRSTGNLAAMDPAAVHAALKGIT